MRYAARFIVTPGFRREHILHCFPKLFWVLSPFLNFIFVIVGFSFSLRIVAVVSQCFVCTPIVNIVRFPCFTKDFITSIHHIFQLGINPRARPSFDPLLMMGACLSKMSLTMVLKIFAAVFTSGAKITGSQLTFSNSRFIDVWSYDL